MSNPTSNFGWQMPTATDLVTDLPADFEVFGQAVDTALMDLKGGTTGQILAKNTNTDMDFVWVTNDVGDITAVTAGTGITGGGTSGAVTITNDMATTITTNGDLLYGTGSGTYTRRGIGSSGQVLTVSGGVPTWSAPVSGGMTALASGTLSGSTVTLNSISGDYNNLRLVIRRFDPSDDGQPIRMRFNNDSSAAYNDIAAMTNSSRGFTNSEINVGGGQDNGTSYSSIVIDIPDYAFAGNWKMGQYQAMTNNETSPGNSNFYWYGFQWNTGATFAAISRIDLFLSSGTFSGGTYVLYGVK